MEAITNLLNIDSQINLLKERKLIAIHNEDYDLALSTNQEISYLYETAAPLKLFVPK